VEARVVIVLGIDTATMQTSVALGTERGPIAQMSLSVGRSHEEIAAPIIEQLLAWSETSLDQLGGVAVGIGPGLFTGLRVGVETARTLAQVLSTPIVGIPSLDVLAFPLRDARRSIGAVIDARRGEVFVGFYLPVPGGVTRSAEFIVVSPDGLAAEIEARGEEMVLVGDGALRYRRELARLGGQVEFASPSLAYPQAASLVELSVPRLEREEFDRPFEVVPLYLRKSDAEIAWDKRARAG
jgi:tRNA threonylcarbamoyladenosine biosynthesis protein TsaB